MWLEAFALTAIVLFFFGLVAVLQGWSNSTASGRATGLAFVVLMAAAAGWGLQVLTGPAHGRAVGRYGMPHGLVLISAILVVIVGIVLYLVISRQKPPEPPHFGR